VPDDSLAPALAALRAAGTAAGLPVAAVDNEAAMFVAGICGDDPAVAPRWAATFGQPEVMFATSASRGRAFRDVETELLARITNDGTAPELAQGYAKALVDLASAAVSLGSPSLDCINAAGFAASAQLRAVAPPSARVLPSATDILKPLSSGMTPTIPVPPAGSAPPATPEAAPPAAAEAAPAAAPAKDEKPPPSLDELLAQLDDLIGLAAVKDEIHHQTELLRIETLRKSKGLKTPGVSKHLVFSGNPGTGKTTVARLVGGIYRAVGVLEKGQLIETDRAGLVAGYVGQTALKTADVIKSAIGGVLFIDEAYSLATDDFGNEAIDTLVKAMEDHRDELVLIVAGYTLEMAAFIASNPGLESRFRTTIEFPDYSDDELVAIFTSLCKDADFTPTDGCIERLRLLLKTVPRDRAFGNGRWVRNQFEAAVVRQAWRLRETASPSVDELQTLLPDDLEALPTVEPPADAPPTPPVSETPPPPVSESQPPTTGC
jgi:hypothetical protein